MFHLKVRDIFDIRGRGIVVLGTIESGTVSVGDKLFLVSGTAQLPAIVASIEKFQQDSLDEASAGPDDVRHRFGGDHSRADSRSGFIGRSYLSYDTFAANEAVEKVAFPAT